MNDYKQTKTRRKYKRRRHVRFDSYLTQFRRRYKLRIIATTVAAVLFSILCVSLLTVILKNSLADSNWLYYPARLLLLVLPVVILFAVLWKPYQRFKKTAGAAELEQAVPEFDGRVDTYLDMKRRKVQSPFVGLLAKDAGKTAAKAPLKSVLPFGDVAGPAIASVGLLALAGWMFTAMPLDWRASMKQLYMGWFVTDILPERSIAISPGDTKIRIGDSLFITAATDGFDSGFADLHVRMKDATDENEWETVAMNPQDDGSFAYTLYGLSESVEYYVSASFTDSDRASVEVVVPAKIISITHNYTYPDWTNLEPATSNDATDIYAVVGTKAEVIFETDQQLEQAILVYDGEELVATALEDLRYSATLTVSSEGTYQLFEGQQNDRIPLSPEYRIGILEDAEPTVTFSLPGGDWSATPIEEVMVAVKADDDFAVEAVTLHYSVNGAPEEQITLNTDNNFEHLFMLEEFTSEFGGPLIAGDIVSYYAEAKDREKSVTTDMLFIDIRPFERRFTQSQQSGGGGGGGGGQQEQEISQRQKEILVSTFNLIRDAKKAEDQNSESPLIDPQDTATLLADLQNTLGDQAYKLAERADARQLLNNDPDIARFVEYMQEAEQSMRPSAQALSVLELEDAVKSQQRALQYLKRAESVFNDITINRNNSEGGGGGGASQDMAEMYELEMDLAKNQYETPDSVPQEEADQQSSDDAFDKLKELARRQQQLADAAARNEQLSETDRWQQEKLRRELEELKRELERQQASNSQNQQNQQSEGQQSDGQQSQQSNSQGSQGEQSSSSNDNSQQAMQNLEEAIEELKRAEENRANLTPEERRQAMQSASDKLRQSLEQTADQRQQELQQQITDAADALRELNREQQQTSEQLREAMRRSMEARKENRFESGLSRAEEARLAEQKRQLQRDLEEIRQQIDDTSNRFAEQAPLTSERLEQALNELDKNQASELLGISGDMIEEGMAPQAALREERINEALRNLQTDLFESSSLAAAETGTGDEQQANASDATRTLQQLRQALTEALAQSGQAGESIQTAELQQLDRGNTGESQSGEGEGESEGDQNGDGQGQQNDGQQGQGQQGQGLQGQGQQGQSTQGQSTRGQSGGTQSGNATNWGPNNGESLDREIQINNGQEQLIEESITQLQQFIGNSSGELSEQSIQDLTELARQLQAVNDDENNRRIEADVRLLLRQLEQLELQIYNETKSTQIVHSKQKVEDPEGFDQQAADYFRNLSESAGS